AGHRRFSRPISQGWSDAWTDDAQPILRYSRDDSPWRPDGTRGVAPVFVPIGGTCRTVPRHARRIEGQDRLLLPPPGLERHHGDGGGLSHHLDACADRAGAIVGAGDPRSRGLSSRAGVVLPVSFSTAAVEGLFR